MSGREDPKLSDGELAVVLWITAVLLALLVLVWWFFERMYSV
jgi:hypothetical protein